MGFTALIGFHVLEESLTPSLIFLQAVADEKVGTLISFEVFADQMMASN